MVNYCCILHCKSNSEDNPNLKFIKLPNETNRCNHLVQMMGLTNLANGNSVCLSNKIICSAHFADSQFGKTFLTSLTKSRVPVVVKSSKWFKPNEGIDSSISSCDTCNENVDGTNNSSAVQCTTCSSFHHKLCVEVNTENEVKNWRCAKCKKLLKSSEVGSTNFNLADTSKMTKEEMQEAEITFLKGEIKVLQDRNDYLENQVSLMQFSMMEMEGNRKPELDIATTNSEFDLISPKDENEDFWSSEAASRNCKLEQTEIIENQESLMVESKIELPDITVEHEEIMIKVEGIEENDSAAVQEENENLSLERKDIPESVSNVDQNVGKKFKEVSEGLEHLGTHIKLFICEVCGKNYLKRKYLRTHMRSHTGEMPYMCHICGKQFQMHSSWFRHTQSHTGEKPFKCNECGKTFKQKSNLQGHYLAIHTGEKFVCEVCDRQFSLKSVYIRHVKSHPDGDPSKTAKSVARTKAVDGGICHICGKNFKKKKAFNFHMKIHSGEKPFTCTICGLKFVLQTNCKHHMMRHTGEKPHACDVCDRKFTLKSNLKRHMLTHTGERPFTCSLCKKSFSQKVALQLHYKVHTGEKNFGCAKCNYICSSKGQLGRHVLIHLKDKPFGCDNCDKRFLKVAELRKHSIIHYKDSV